MWHIILSSGNVNAFKALLSLSSLALALRVHPQLTLFQNSGYTSSPNNRKGSKMNKTPKSMRHGKPNAKLKAGNSNHGRVSWHALSNATKTLQHQVRRSSMPQLLACFVDLFKAVPSMEHTPVPWFSKIIATKLEYLPPFFVLFLHKHGTGTVWYSIIYTFTLPTWGALVVLRSKKSWENLRKDDPNSGNENITPWTVFKIQLLQCCSGIQTTLT